MSILGFLEVSNEKNTYDRDIIGILVLIELVAALC